MLWQMEADEWLETLCLNRTGEVISRLLEEIGDYSSSWTDTVNQLRRESVGGGRLFREVTDPEYWTFDNEDPTVKNLVSGVQAQDIATRILNRFQLSNMELLDICQTVHQSLGGKPVYGSDRVDIPGIGKPAGRGDCRQDQGHRGHRRGLPVPHIHRHPV